MAVQANANRRLQGSDQRGRYRPLSEINVTPFVDVMLVLLIVFMVTAPLLTVGVDVNLPMNEGDDLPDGKIFYVSIKEDGSVYLQNQKIPLEKVAPRMKAVFKANPELTVYFRGDRNLSYGRVMDVVEALKDAGMQNLGLVTKPEVGSMKVSKLRNLGRN
tara:strand:+ start:1847 stop:2326 length:480 start_codon:yes stop_codon:yes gene_type:complete